MHALEVKVNLFAQKHTRIIKRNVLDLLIINFLSGRYSEGRVIFFGFRTNEMYEVNKRIAIEHFEQSVRRIEAYQEDLENCKTSETKKLLKNLINSITSNLPVEEALYTSVPLFTDAQTRNTFEKLVYKYFKNKLHNTRGLLFPTIRGRWPTRDPQQFYRISKNILRLRY